MTRKVVFGKPQDSQEILDNLLLKSGSNAQSNAQEAEAINHCIDPDIARNTTVLSGLLGISRSTVHQWQLEGRLPNNENASYRQCIQHLIGYLEMKSKGQSTGLQEAALIQKLELDKVRTEQAWLSVKEKRAELIELAGLATVFEPILLQIRQQVMSFARKFPEHQLKMDQMLDSWQQLGLRMLNKSREEFDAFIALQMESEFQPGESDEDRLGALKYSEEDISQYKEVKARTDAAIEVGNKSGRRGEGRAEL